MSDEQRDPVSAYVVEQCTSVLDGEAALRHDPDVDGVHDTRVALRKVRSTVRVFAPVLVPGRATLSAFDDDLRWVAGVLGEVRDTDVLSRHVHRQLRDVPPEMMLGPVAEEIDTALAERRADALRRWEEARTREPDASRYAATLDAVAAWRDSPPVLDDDAGRLDEKGPRVLNKARRKARQRLDEAGHDPAAIHRARKSLKRLRYAAELLRPVVPEARKTAKRAKRLQRSLGTHQDLTVESAFLREQAARFGAQAGHNGFTYGLLLGRAEAHAAALRRDLSW